MSSRHAGDWDSLFSCDVQGCGCQSFSAAPELALYHTSPGWVESSQFEAAPPVTHYPKAPRNRAIEEREAAPLKQPRAIDLTGQFGKSLTE